MSAKRPFIVAGNWKMNKTYEEGRDLLTSIINKLSPNGALVIIGTPYIHLKNAHNLTGDISFIRIAAQNCHQETNGAYTGEISASMLQSVGAEYVILGHSERRQYFREDDELIADKVDQVLRHGMQPIYCCGEKLETREKEEHLELVEGQLKKALFHLSADQFSKVVVAYEPVWAIGTGKTASPEQVQEMHAHIRDVIAKYYNQRIADATPILYGGSVKPHNAAELFGQDDVDGGLIGGASLKAEDFIAIVGAYEAKIIA